MGSWLSSPVGRLDDLMWAQPDGRRVLVAATEEGAGYVSSVYGFDEVVVGPLEVRLEGRFLDPVSYTHLTLPTICSV